MFGPSETGIIQQNIQHSNYKAAIEVYYDYYRDKHNQYVKDNKAILNYYSN